MNHKESVKVCMVKKKKNKFGEKEDEEMRQMLRDQFTAQTIRSNLLYLFIYLLGESVTV